MSDEEQPTTVSWEEFANRVTRAVLDVFPYALAVGVGQMTKVEEETTPLTRKQRALNFFRKPHLREKPSVTMKSRLIAAVSVIDEAVPQEKWAPVSGWGSPQAMQQSIARNAAMVAIKNVCSSHGVACEYYFTPVTWFQNRKLENTKDAERCYG